MTRKGFQDQPVFGDFSKYWRDEQVKTRHFTAVTDREVPDWLVDDIEEALQDSRDGNVVDAADVFAEIRAEEEDG